MDLPSLKPWEHSLNFGSYIVSKIVCIPFCTIFSLGDPTPSDLPSDLPGFGIITLLAGVNLKRPVRISCARS